MANVVLESRGYVCHPMCLRRHVQVVRVVRTVSTVVEYHTSCGWFDRPYEFVLDFSAFSAPPQDGMTFIF